MNSDRICVESKATKLHISNVQLVPSSSYPLVNCVSEFKDQWNPATQTLIGETSSCPSNFLPHLIDAGFGIGGNTNLRYTSSVFYTDNLEVYFNSRDDFDDMTITNHIP